MREEKYNPVKIFELHKNERPVFIAAPMVRYSKLPFRQLVRDYNADIVYTPMILAKEFLHPEGRYFDFSTNEKDRSLVVQFGVEDPVILAQASEIVAPYTDAIGINCGCPQPWAIQEGIGSALLKQPQKVHELVRSVKSALGETFCVEVKIRLDNDLEKTRQLMQTAERAGADFITVHGRRRADRSSFPVDLEAIRSVRPCVSIPVVANGDVNDLDTGLKIAEYTNTDGVMSARGLMENPALFAGYTSTPWGCVEKFVAYATGYSLNFQLFEHHLMTMMGKMTTKRERMQVPSESYASVIDWLDETFVLRRPGETEFGTTIEPVRRDANGLVSSEIVTDDGSIETELD
ncbi:tRNA dihydrouridine synthase Dus4 [Schizosaccharomyces japonicus yFS275]|uniref:tRNA-dihydrouridine synthase n=1 Tax=Schizosaccharomyces japonicus (strain yFS275 / FY16936) TaxID=402676 RepID=B6JXB4_SCHJY|nr:tRNA dihydrouridine synthase Dus4 [Schizosaccharomyces japonicus yFS275]EEB06015.1 tRNA dihydrouridine synthase Dus4 [Schizosaccharomyces japonicus yFS275]